MYVRTYACVRVQDVNRQYCLRHGYEFVAEVRIYTITHAPTRTRGVTSGKMYANPNVFVGCEHDIYMYRKYPRIPTQTANFISHEHARFHKCKF